MATSSRMQLKPLRSSYHLSTNLRFLLRMLIWILSPIGIVSIFTIYPPHLILERCREDPSALAGEIVLPFAWLLTLLDALRHAIEDLFRNRSHAVIDQT